MVEPRPPISIERYVLLYALAWAGGTIAYTPLLTILLPVQAAGLAGTRAAVDWLAYAALAGAIAASLGGIGFGYLSDVTRNRRGWIASGLVLSCILLIAIGQVTSLTGLVAAIVCWQLSLNMMLGPLAAWAGDLVPDDHKGVLGGMMAFAPGLGALSGALVTQPGLAEGSARLWLVAMLVMICVLPVLLVRAPSRPQNGQRPQELPETQSGDIAARRRALLMWLARLFVQIAEATLFAYLFYWLISIDPSISDNQTARLFSATMLTAAPLALVAGRWSDLAGRPITPLWFCAGLAALGLAAMALAESIVMAMLAYGLFGVCGAVFLALHSAQTLRLLPRPDRRGRDLGLFNLANTVPSLIMPWLAMALIPLFGFRALFLLLALLAAAAATLLRTLNVVK